MEHVIHPSVRRSRSNTFAIAVVAGLGTAALGASGTWNGSTSSDWDDPTNWTGGLPNAIGDIATFNADVPFDNPTLDANTTIGRLTVSGTAPALTISSTSNSLTFDGQSFVFMLSNGQQTTLDLDFSTKLADTPTTNTFQVGTTSRLTFAAGNTWTTNRTANFWNQLSGGGTWDIDSAIVNTGAGNRLLTAVHGTVNFNASSITGTLSRLGVKSNGAGTTAFLNLHRNLLASEISTIEIGDNGGTSVNTLRLSQNNLTVASGLTIAATGAAVGSKSHTFELDLAGTNAGEFSGNIAHTSGTTNSATEIFSVGANDSLTFSGIVTYLNHPNYALQKTGDGTLVFSGATANSFAPGTTFQVLGGTLQLQKSAGTNAIDNDLAVSSGASVKLAADDQIANSSALTLLGGAFDANGLSETLGALTINGANSSIDFGAGSSTLQFASGAFTAGGLTIYNWDGPADSWRFGSDPTAFVAALGNDLVFDGYGPGGTVTDLGGGVWEVTPVPEPSTSLLLLAGLGSACTLWRRRR